jgi:hypothetical protein
MQKLASFRGSKFEVRSSKFRLLTFQQPVRDRWAPLASNAGADVVSSILVPARPGGSARKTKTADAFSLGESAIIEADIGRVMTSTPLAAAR